MSTILTNCKCFIKGNLQNLEIAIKNGKFVEIGNNLSKKLPSFETIDLKNLTVLPGLIDSQVHFREPGPTHKEDLTTGSQSALAGGVTTFLEMPNTSPPTTTYENFLEKVKIAKEVCCTNFGFFIGANGKNLEEIKKTIKHPNCCGIKIFLGSSTGDLLLYEESSLMEIFESVDCPIALHSENEIMLRERVGIKNNAKTAHDHPVWRSVETAFSSTKRIIELAKKANKKIHILHISTQEEIEFLKDHKDICTVEVLPQHLTLESPHCYDQLGTYAQMNPPIREKRHQDALWEGVKNGTVDMIGSDHAPHTREEKDQGYPNSPSGMPGVQTIVPLMLNYVNEGKIGLSDLVRLMSENPAKLYSLNKGSIEIGKDADLTIVDMNEEFVIQNQQVKSKCGWTPFHGKKVKGRPKMACINGKLHTLN